MNWMYGLVLAGIVAWGAHRKGWLKRSGGLAAVAVGTAMFAGGVVSTAALLFFFFSTAAIGRWVLPYTRTTPIATEQSIGRGASQVLAVGLVPAVGAVAFAGTQDPVWLWVTISSLSFAASDSWSTEIGQTSKTSPRLLLWGPHVMTGQSGGMTVRGTGAALVGAFALAWVASLGTPLLNFRSVVVLSGVGLAGSALDSLLGASLQSRRRCGQCGEPTELPAHCGVPSVCERRGLSNTGVNLVCSAMAGLGGGWLYP
jgi:uncharacterized protein (TIGR00297 family)